MITKEALLEAGYKQFPVYHKEFSRIGYQKRFDDPRGKKYFIIVYEYDNRGLKETNSSLVHMPDFAYEPDVQFDRDGVTFDVRMHANKDTSVVGMEWFFEDLWQSMCCDYYELWEES